MSSRSTVPSGALARSQAVLMSQSVIEKSNLKQDITLCLKLRTPSIASRHAVQLKSKRGMQVEGGEVLSPWFYSEIGKVKDEHADGFSMVQE